MVELDLAQLLQIPRWLVGVLSLAWAVLVTVFVMLERRRPAATLAWILALVLIPLFGVFAYVLFGRQAVRQRRRRRERRPLTASEAMRQMARLDTLPAGIEGMQRGLVRLALHAAAAPLRRATQVAMLPAGGPAAAALHEAIAQAAESLHLEFYIWRDDTAGRRLTAALTERARAGVAVRVLIDHLGSFGLPESHFDALREAGGRVERFAPIHLAALRGAHANFRNHRKIVTVDRKIGFFGGLNVGDEYLGGEEPGHLWEDLLIRLEGDAALGLEGIFIEDWLEATDEWLDPASSRPTEGPGRLARLLGRGPRAGSAGPLVQIVPSGPDLRVADAIAAQMLAAISSAQSRCWIATPYFVPDEPLRLALVTAALRGVDVRLVLPGRSDVRVVQFASRSYYDELLAAGCQILEHPGMLHAKYMVVDETLASLGSANMDTRSFYLNYEVTGFFYDRGVNHDLAETFLRSLDGARSVTTEERLALPGTTRLLEAAARVLSPLL